MSALKKPAVDYQKLYSDTPSPEKKAVEDLKKRINGLLEDPKNARKAALILERWLRQKSK